MNILVCGDSHTGVFRYSNTKQSKYRFNVCEVGGATALGLVNPNSKTNALPIFSKTIQNTQACKLIIMLGEVDCGFVIWVRSKRYNMSVDEQINESINNLFIFIQDEIINKKKYKPCDIIIAGSVLPTIRDNADKNLLGGARSEVDVSQKIRTMKTLEYNNILKMKCSKYDYEYIDITNFILDKKENIVSSNFLNKNPHDHHLDNEKTYNLWIQELDIICRKKST
jgi:hypothetical protein